jgi:hypothetical protein
MTILVSAVMRNVWVDQPILLTNCTSLQQEPTYIDDEVLLLKERIETIQPTVFLISIPFLGICTVLFDQRNG